GFDVTNRGSGPAISGTGTIGVFGISHTKDQPGLAGANDAMGPLPSNEDEPEFGGPGVVGHSRNHNGVRGESEHDVGVFGISHTKDQSGLRGENDAKGPLPSNEDEPEFGGPGVVGHSRNHNAVRGESEHDVGVF